MKFLPLVVVLSYSGAVAASDAYVWKTGHRGGCSVHTSQSGVSDGKGACTQLGAACDWYSLDTATGTAYMCDGDVDGFDNAEMGNSGGDVWSSWMVYKKVAQPNDSPSVAFESKVGRGGCPDSQSIQSAVHTEGETQALCESLGDKCRFYTWSNDVSDGSQGYAWFCSTDNYDTADVSGSWPLFKVGRIPLTSTPTTNPTGAPTVSPTGTPTGSPTGTPTGSPTGAPTGSPTNGAFVPSAAKVGGAGGASFSVIEAAVDGDKVYKCQNGLCFESTFGHRKEMSHVDSDSLTGSPFTTTATTSDGTWTLSDDGLSLSFKENGGQGLKFTFPASCDCA